ncbi:MAG: helix-turn-helix domain-containing protein [Magnetococcales bacterium]|nr:helix-turn-helix domain-containing protein [Magnetococcales bacterium]
MSSDDFNRNDEFCLEETQKEGKLLGERIRAARRHAEMSQSDFAEKIGVTSNTLSRHERGETIPSADVLKKIIEALGYCVSADWLLFGKADAFGKDPVRVKDFGAVTALNFDGKGSVDVVMGSSDLVQILETLREIEKSRKNPKEEVVDSLGKLIERYDTINVEMILEALISVHGVDLIPFHIYHPGGKKKMPHRVRRQIV